ncbi:MAG: type II restriction endonuclease subunit M [Candidatus Accumulibacter sp. UW26]
MAILSELSWPDCTSFRYTHDRRLDIVTTFLRLLAKSNKAGALSRACAQFRQGEPDPCRFEVAPESFDAVPGKPFAYWVSEAVRGVFVRLPRLEGDHFAARQGGVNGDDFRWLRLWLEMASVEIGRVAAPIAKGGNFSPYYSAIYLVALWDRETDTFFAFTGLPHRPSLQPASFDYYFRPGLTWSRRTSSGISLRAMPCGCIFADKGPAAFVANDEPDELLALLAVANSRPFSILVELQLAAADAAARSYEVGIIQKTPIPPLPPEQRQQLAILARRAWSLKRTLDTVNETSHAFLLPAALRSRPGAYDPPAIEAELARIQAEIDAIAFDLYDFAEADRQAVNGIEAPTEGAPAADEDDEDPEADVPSADALLSWAVGVAFGRFDWRLATGEREAPPEPDPFDPLPARSPGMLPEEAAPFHAHAGILVDDPGHPHDLARLVEGVLEQVSLPVPNEVQRWLQRDFFAFHLQRYAKSRRKAPIYWPLATPSGSYTLWIYYPSLSSQTLYTAINDFVEPRLKQVGDDVTALRNKGSARTRDDEKQFETLQAFELELIELRDTLLKSAQGYQPNHDDGVQITAAPLWPLFRHKPWQKILKDTWARLERGDYDWAHLAMSYWPTRVREKCRTDKSLAIAYDLEALYVEPEAKPRTTRGKKMGA